MQHLEAFRPSLSMLAAAASDGHMSNSNDSGTQRLA
jgi:hypothetical protein